MKRWYDLSRPGQTKARLLSQACLLVALAGQAAAQTTQQVSVSGPESFQLEGALNAGVALPGAPAGRIYSDFLGITPLSGTTVGPGLSSTAQATIGQQLGLDAIGSAAPCAGGPGCGVLIPGYVAAPGSGVTASDTAATLQVSLNVNQSAGATAGSASNITTPAGQTGAASTSYGFVNSFNLDPVGAGGAPPNLTFENTVGQNTFATTANGGVVTNTVTGATTTTVSGAGLAVQDSGQNGSGLTTVGPEGIATTGTLFVGGLSTTHGIANNGGLANTGGLTTDTLAVSGQTTTSGITNAGGLTNTGGLTTDTLAVSGKTTTAGITNTGGIANTGGLATDTLAVSGESSTHGIDNNGAGITGVADGAISPTSTDAVNGSQLYAEVNRAEYAELRLDHKINASTAMAAALAGAVFLPGNHINLTANVATYEGASAASFQGAVLVNRHLGFTGGVAFKVGGGTYGSGSTALGRVGVTVGW